MTTKPANPSPTTNPSAAKRAARTEAFRQKNARRRAQRADKRSRLTRGEYLEWRHQMRLVQFYPAKVKKEILDGKSLSQDTPERSSVRRDK
ncbi:MAG: hypothetical protein FJW09_09325 [Actinobacteria bacterium]|nr:hypothetical protein [Actinomycetota bacterium]